MLTYFVQVNVCWLLFYGAYFALLSRETFFRLNRIWLIISLLAGLILPLVAPTLTVVEPTNMAAIMLEPIVISATDLGQNLQNSDAVAFKILAAMYGLGVAVSLGKLLMGFWKIKRLLNRAEKLPMDDFMLMQVREAIAPFSFFRWVFINLNLVEHADLQQIILHERAHVRERHSLDVVFAEVLGVVFWWSPLVYFYTKSLKNVHEYAADEVVLRTSSPPQYGRLLLRQQQSGMSLSLANPFFSQLKKRILMMTRNPSKRRALAKYALALPIFLVLTLLLASPKTRVMATTEAATDKVVASIETFEKNITTPQGVGNETITPNDLAIKSEKMTPLVSDGFAISLEDSQLNSKLTDNTASLLDNSNKPQNGFTSDEKEQPIILLANRSGGAITPEELVKQDKLEAFGIVDGKTVPLEIQSFVLFRAPRHDDPMQVNNTGGLFNEEAQRVIQMAKADDQYQFMEIKCRVKGEEKARYAGSIGFVVKELTPQYNVQKDSSDPVFTIVEENPTFVGGNDSLFRFLGRNIIYPAEARKLNVEGTVYVGFVVEKDGSITNVKVKRNVPKTAIKTVKVIGVDDLTGTKKVMHQDQSCAQEAIRVIKLMPKWQAGKAKSVPVRVAFTLPIKFKLE